ncbi:MULTISPECIES: hypothetical protein [Pseudoalteromonas]|uniref:Uncharacterized protein n=1 Tax=Pseudoalteromonas rubra TaxID=43658 RepID=A0A5S3V2C6_9GAMM|nr:MULTISPECIES: hypothetical protein [Pseudoalteromonas]MCG7561464.1 hypothetical protein [Pseudoalteromonas sp. McH1-42]MEC4088052.1 hypothetical protein [Pseudoalteromonas rubra]QPB85881.1 hypothetical protein CWC22_023045 [Pseudoalteromonas rubra]
MKVTKFVLPLVLSGLFAANAQASMPGECDDLMIGLNMDRYVQYETVQRVWIKAGNSTKCVRVSPDLHNSVYRVLSKQVAMRNQLKSELHTKLDQELRNNATGLVEHRYTNTDLTGNLSTKLSANGNGEILANVNGFGFNAKAKYTIKNVPSFIAKAYARVSAQNIVVTAKYDFVTGQAYGLNVNPINLNIDVDSRIFGISVPLLSNYINNKVEGIISSKIHGYLNTKTDGWSASLFSLDKAIPDDRFGQLGVSVKDRLKSLAAGQYIRLSSSATKIEGASLYVDLSGDYSITMSSKTIENPCYIYSDRPCSINPF